MTALIRSRPHGKGILDRNKGGLVLHMNDQMKSSSIWSDMSGYDNHGSVFGAATPPAATPGALGYVFDGVDDYVDALNNESLNFTTFTISIWVKPVSLIGSIGVIGNNAYILKTTGDEIRLTTPSISDLTSSGALLSVNEWNHIIVTFIVNGTTYFYSNGKLISSTASGLINFPTDNLRLGTVSDTDFNGSIDEVRIYNRALSATEIKRLYERTRILFGV